MARVAPYLTAREAAEALTKAGITVSDEAVRNWIRSGRIASLRLPSGRMLVPMAAVKAIIAGEATEAGAA